MQKIQNTTQSSTALDNKEILSFNQACIFLDVSASWLYKLTCSNTIPYYKPNGKKIYFKKTELEDWLLGKKIKSNHEMIESVSTYKSGNKR